MFGNFEIPILGDLGRADGFLPHDPGAFALLFGLFLLLGDLGLLGRAQAFQFLNLGDLCLLLIPFDTQLAALGLHRGLTDSDLGLGVDLGALFLGLGDDLRQFPHTDSVKGVVFIKRVKRGLVQSGQRDRFQLKPVFQQIFGYCILNFLHEFRAVLVQLVHGHLRSHRTQTVHQLTFDHLAKLIDVEGPVAQCLGRAADAFDRGVDRDIEFHADIDAHPILGNQGRIRGALNLKPQGLHVDRADLVQQGHNDGAAVHDDLLAARAGLDEADLPRGPLVKPPKDQANQDEKAKDTSDNYE